MLVFYGVLQERIISQPYGVSGAPQRFRNSIFLVFVNRLFAILLAVAMVIANGESFKNSAPLWKYGLISLTNVYASACQYEALKHINFSVQMLGKSFKMMPVMMWGMVISGKRFPVTDWVVATAVTLGVTEFLLSGPITSNVYDANTSRGFTLLVMFLALDGFTSTFQEKLFNQHVTSKYNQMLYINMGSATISLLTLIASGSLLSSIEFSILHPQFMWDCVALSGAAVSGQWFIYSQVKDFGALTFAATMNVRQVVSIIVSNSHFHHLLTNFQRASLGIVFSALFYKSYAGIFGSAAARPEKQSLLGKDEKGSAAHDKL